MKRNPKDPDDRLGKLPSLLRELAFGLQRSPGPLQYLLAQFHTSHYLRLVVEIVAQSRWANAGRPQQLGCAQRVGSDHPNARAYLLASAGRQVLKQPTG